MSHPSPSQVAVRLAACVALGAAIWSAPVPAGLEQKVAESQVRDEVRESVAQRLEAGDVPSDRRDEVAATLAKEWSGARSWHLFAVFMAVIAGFVLRPFPMGPIVLLGMVVLLATRTVEMDDMMAGYGNSTTWLIVSAFLIAGAVLRSGFGRRLSLLLVHRLGRSTLGVGYALCGAELVLGPAIPSNTARGGGLLAPITRSLAEALGSTPTHRPGLIGGYLCLVGAHASIISSAMYLTAMAANPIVVEAADIHLGVEFTWGRWLLGSIVPGLVSMALLPLVFYRLAPPEMADAAEARHEARRQLDAMGPWSWPEKVLCAVLLLMVILWATQPVHGLGTTLVAWLGIVTLLVTGTEKWQDVVENTAAWDTLIWLGGLLSMATALKDYRFIEWFSTEVQGLVSGLDGITVALVLTLVYLYSMYCFSMMTAHITAMVAAFFVVASAAGAPPLLIVPLLAYFSCLCATVTNYSTGPVIIYYGLGYVPAPKWFATGFIMSLYHVAIWFTVGMAWWKLLGWW